MSTSYKVTSLVKVNYALQIRSERFKPIKYLQIVNL